MPKRVDESGPTDKRPYKSKFADIWLTPAQYLAEMACSRKAEKEGVKLVPRFWQLDTYKSDFKTQMIMANRLLKKYAINHIILAFNDFSMKWCYSLGSPKLVECINKKIRLLSNLEKLTKSVNEEPEVWENLPETAPSFISEKSTVDKLKELDS